MAETSDPNAIGDLQSLDALFGPAGEASVRKQVPYLHPIYREWISKSPFALLATFGPSGLDASPRGDPPDFVSVLDDHTLLIPEKRGRGDGRLSSPEEPRQVLVFLHPRQSTTIPEPRQAFHV